MARKEVDTVYILQRSSPRLSPYEITCALKRRRRRQRKERGGEAWLVRKRAAKSMRSIYLLT